MGSRTNLPIKILATSHTAINSFVPPESNALPYPVLQTGALLLCYDGLSIYKLFVRLFVHPPGLEPGSSASKADVLSN